MADFLKDYEPVEDRLRAFWSDHPLGRIITELVHVGEDGYIVKASAWRSGGTPGVWSKPVVFVPKDMKHVPMPLPTVLETAPPDATGYAQEAVTDRGVNATSALENCETSAIGRALANLGYAAKGRRPSREEMSKASPAAETGEGSVAGGSTSASSSKDRTQPEAAMASSPPASGFPVTDCDHHYPTGVPAKVTKGGTTTCRLCGMDWIAAMEGTTADLGAAT